MFGFKIYLTETQSLLIQSKKIP